MYVPSPTSLCVHTNVVVALSTLLRAHTQNRSEASFFRAPPRVMWAEVILFQQRLAWAPGEKKGQKQLLGFYTIEEARADKIKVAGESAERGNEGELFCFCLKFCSSPGRKPHYTSLVNALDAHCPLSVRCGAVPSLILTLPSEKEKRACAFQVQRVESHSCEGGSLSRRKTFFFSPSARRKRLS